MDDRWDDGEAAQLDGAVGSCVYASRLIGSDPALVLHGGGNTSCKAPWRDVTGDDVDALYVKGSGWDLATIAEPGFAPLDRRRLHRLLELDDLTDTEMMAALSAARLDTSAPQPSVEALLHALLPDPFVLHSHADAIVTITHLRDGADRVREAMGDDVLVVPYVMPGFPLAKTVAAMWPPAADVTGIVLLDHGLFTSGATARAAYARHVELITRAERWIDACSPARARRRPATLPEPSPVDLADLRRAISVAAGRPMITTRHVDGDAARFVCRDDLAALVAHGPLTPDHVIRTKRVPMVGRDVDAYVDAYRSYVDAHRARLRGPLVPIDPAPRVVLDRDLGMVTVGPTAADAAIAADVYRHTMAVLERAEDDLGGYRGLTAADVFDVEYWELEQAKLRRAGDPAELAGQVALVTGAASGIGRACALELRARGAAVAGIDIAPDVVAALQGSGWLGVECDVTDEGALAAAVRATVDSFGGVDLVVIAAGVFGASRLVADLDADEWRRTMAVNVDAVARLLPMVHPLLARSPASPAVVVVASRNVLAPGRSAAAYSASKAALTQLARVTALEWAGDGIRVNCLHPDAVFDTGLWTDDLVAERAAAYGLTVDQYKRRNLLGVEITASDVARVAAALCGTTFSKTTGAQVPVDGGSDRVV